MDDLLAEHLTERLEAAVHRHLSVAQDWLPHEYVPWEQGRDFASLPWEETQSVLSAPVRAAVALNLLTEDNLPGYHSTLAALYGDRDPWRAWLDRWTAEEGRHGIVLRDYLVVTRAVDPVALERDRMATVSGGYRAPEKDVLRALCYVVVPGARDPGVAPRHRAGCPATRAWSGCSPGSPWTRTCTWSSTATSCRPRSRPTRTATLRAIVDEVAGFAMPGTGIPQFVRRAAVVARAGIYDLPCTATRWSRRCCATGRCSSSRASAPTGSRRARTCPRCSPSSTAGCRGCRRGESWCARDARGEAAAADRRADRQVHRLLGRAGRRGAGRHRRPDRLRAIAVVDEPHREAAARQPARDRAGRHQRGAPRRPAGPGARARRRPGRRPARDRLRARCRPRARRARHALGGRRDGAARLDLVLPRPRAGLPAPAEPGARPTSGSTSTPASPGRPTTGWASPRRGSSRRTATSPATSGRTASGPTWSPPGRCKTMAAKSIPGFGEFEQAWKDRAPLGWDVTAHEPVARTVVRGAERLVPGDDRLGRLRRRRVQRGRASSTAQTTRSSARW